MAWIYGEVSSGNATQKLADILSEAAIGISLQTIDAVAVGGSDYVVGDEITLSGGDFTIAAVAEVLTVDNDGAVLTARVRNAGIYQEAPTNDVVTTGGTGTGCELTCTFDFNGWVRRRATNVAGAAQSATIDDGGTDYAVGNILTAVGGTGHTPATFRVASVTSGVVTAVTVVNPGSYATPPTNPVATTGGAGTGCELDIVFGSSSSGLAREIILEGEGDSGTDEILVGWLSFTSELTQQLELAGFTGIDLTLPWANQPGISPGRSGSNGGAYCPTQDATIPFWVSVTKRRIMFSYRVIGFYGSGHLGLIDTMATVGEWPYPIYIAGCQTMNAVAIGHTTNQGTSCVNPGSLASSSYSNGYLRRADGAWQAVANTMPGTTEEASTGTLTLPWASPNFASTDDAWAVRNNNVVSVTQGAFPPDPSFGNTQTYRVLPTPNGGDDLFLRIPVTILSVGSSIHGNIAGAFAVNSANLFVVESRLSEGDRRFFVTAHNNSANDPRGLWCIEEA